MSTGAGLSGILEASPGCDWSLFPPNLAFDPAVLLRTEPQELAGEVFAGAHGQVHTEDPFPLIITDCGRQDIAMQENVSEAPVHTPKSQCYHQLSTILLDLNAIWASLPPETETHFPYDSNIAEHTARFSQRYSHKDLLEKVFASVQQLVDIYPTATQLFLNREPSQTCESTNCTHLLGLPLELAEIETHLLARDNRPHPVDLPLANLLVSCHLRVLDILDRTLYSILSCFKITLASPTQREPDFEAPEVRVGSFTPTRAAAISMQAFLIRHLMDALSTRARQMTEAVTSNTAGQTDKEGRLLVLQCEIVQERHEAKAEHLRVIGEQLHKTGLLERAKT
ncbi:hypothetical protein QBC46DRAFT_393192 [Diplogelasinospora grovesii]|uniref:Transcription factor ACEII n=1 Tax=Diplogelasinospora grovesii TaxID=303347 RepID=A0AAN6N195_9PEZI|nr:hypothetical protein QBC46DRAFT_393192 [Diplogelasinospora grovesii]